jgi:hypothetical protein
MRRLKELMYAGTASRLLLFAAPAMAQFEITLDRCPEPVISEHNECRGSGLRNLHWRVGEGQHGGELRVKAGSRNKAFDDRFDLGKGLSLGTRPCQKIVTAVFVCEILPSFPHSQMAIPSTRRAGGLARQRGFSL